MKDKKLAKNILGWVIYIIVLIILIHGIPKGLAYVLDSPYPMAAITSGSMWPSLKKGDLVLIKGVNNKGEVKVSDIVVYNNPSGFTIHRVVEINGNTITTKGDANNISDPTVKYEDIVGKAVSFNKKPFRVPYLKLTA